MARTVDALLCLHDLGLEAFLLFYQNVKTTTKVINLKLRSTKIRVAVEGKGGKA